MAQLHLRTKQSFDRDKGLYCKSCSRTIRWSKLVITYEFYNNGWVDRTWWCDCGRMLKEEELNIHESDDQGLEGSPQGDLVGAEGSISDVADVARAAKW